MPLCSPKTSSRMLFHALLDFMPHSCSRFLSDIQKKQPDEDCASEPAPSSSNSQSAVFCNETSSSSSQTLSSGSEGSSTDATPLSKQEGELGEYHPIIAHAVMLNYSLCVSCVIFKFGLFQVGVRPRTIPGLIIFL